VSRDESGEKDEGEEHREKERSVHGTHGNRSAANVHDRWGGSIAQVHSFMMDRPVSIVFGPDNLYWVVPDSLARELHRRGFEFCQ
jgi:hypothetical protein